MDTQAFDNDKVLEVGENSAAFQIVRDQSYAIIIVYVHRNLQTVLSNRPPSKALDDFYICEYKREVIAHQAREKWVGKVTKSPTLIDNTLPKMDNLPPPPISDKNNYDPPVISVEQVMKMFKKQESLVSSKDEEFVKQSPAEKSDHTIDAMREGVKRSFQIEFNPLRSLQIEDLVAVRNELRNWRAHTDLENEAAYEYVYKIGNALDKVNQEIKRKIIDLFPELKK